MLYYAVARTRDGSGVGIYLRWESAKPYCIDARSTILKENSRLVTTLVALSIVVLTLFANGADCFKWNQFAFLLGNVPFRDSKFKKFETFEDALAYFNERRKPVIRQAPLVWACYQWDTGCGGVFDSLQCMLEALGPRWNSPMEEIDFIQVRGWEKAEDWLEETMEKDASAD